MRKLIKAFGSHCVAWRKKVGCAHEPRMYAQWMGLVSMRRGSPEGVSYRFRLGSFFDFLHVKTLTAGRSGLNVSIPQMQTVEKNEATYLSVVSALSILACEILPIERDYEPGITGAHIAIAGKPWTLSIQWSSGNYSGIGRQMNEETFEAALWDNSVERKGITDHWIDLNPTSTDDDDGFSMGVQPMAYATLSQIEAAVIAAMTPKVENVDPEF